jgi:hypothetical protein
LNADAGKTRSKMAPINPPSAEAAPNRMILDL